MDLPAPRRRTAPRRFTVSSADKTLIRLVHEKRYRDALDRLNTHPDEVSATDSNDRTALVKICEENRVTTSAITLAQAMLNLKPELMRLRSGKNLLHVAVERSRTGAPRSTELALMLIQADPSCISERSDAGYNPFLSACAANADIVVLKAMLRADPTVAGRLMKSRRGNPSFTAITVMLRRNGWDLTGPSLEKVALILLTAYKGRVEEPLPKQNMVHAVCSYPRPLTFLTRIMRMYPEQASQRDEGGFFPLHYAVKNVGTWDDSEQPFLHCNFVFRKLMKLVKAAPQALSTLDPQYRLYPALVAATRANESSIYLNVTFELLRASPEMIVQAVVNNDEQRSQKCTRTCHIS